MKSGFAPYALDAGSYLARPAERLALRGYRGWTWTVASRSPAPWQAVCRLYRRDLADHAEPVLLALSDFVETLGLCASCPLRMRRADAPGLCRDEALVLALLSAQQHCDEPSIEASIAAITCPAKAESVACAAGVYAMTLKMLDRTLLPIPLQVVDRICRMDLPDMEGEGANRTLH